MNPESPELIFVTSLIGDTRRWLTAAHELYPLALYGYEHHAALPNADEFYGALAKTWPRPSGIRRQQDALEYVAAWLLNANLSPDQLPSLLGYDRETLRRYGTVKRAKEILDAHRLNGAPDVERPRIYTALEYEHLGIGNALYDLVSDAQRTPEVVCILEALCKRDTALYGALVSGLSIEEVRDLPPAVFRYGTASSLEQVQTVLSRLRAAQARDTDPELIDLGPARGLDPEQLAAARAAARAD